MTATPAQCSSTFGIDVFPNLPWMATTIPALAALLQVPVSLLVKAFGERAVATMMILGQLSFVAMGAICVFVSRDEIASWGYGIISLYVLQASTVSHTLCSLSILRAFADARNSIYWTRRLRRWPWLRLSVLVVFCRASGGQLMRVRTVRRTQACSSKAIHPLRLPPSPCLVGSPAQLHTLFSKTCCTPTAS